jgi:cyclopropane fatty-acyl-phospholipid synthase-like methyltransferase
LNKNLFLCDITKDYQLYSDNIELKVDVIHSEEVLEHIAENDLDNVFKNIKKHLKPDGICIFGISLVEDIQIRDYEGNLVENPDLHINKNFQYFKLHQSVFPANWWKQKIEDNGFEIFDGGRNDDNHFGYIFNNTVRWDYYGSAYFVFKLKDKI